MSDPSTPLGTGALPRLTTALADKYRIERELGSGGMATVYLAHDVRHDRKVALKVLKPELSAILGAERFLHEIKTTANLQHPHILSLFDSGEAGGSVFYVMPYIEGESLRDRLIREKQLPVEDAVRIAREVADALEYAHKHGVVHRDIKPENILLHGGHAQVADFGIALAASRSDGGSRMTETGMSLGTPHYMSPEQAMGEKEITPRSDIYALGCVLYEMLTAEPPFVGATAQAIIARVLTEEPRSLTLQRRTIPPHVEATVRRALEKLPADRFPTAAEFARALGDPTFQGPGFGPTGTRAMAAAVGGRRSGWRTLGVATLLVVAIGVAVAGWSRRLPSPIPSRYRITLAPGAHTAPMIGRDLAFSPDGRTIVFTREIEGRRQLWVKTADRPDPEPLTGTTGGRTPAFSPDGEWVAFTAEGRLRKVPRVGGSAVTLSDSISAGPWSTAWLDGGTVLFSGVGLDLRAVAQDGGPARVIIPRDSLGGRFVLAIAGTPGGRTALIVICTFGCTRSQLQAVDLATGARTDLAEDVIHSWSVEGGRVVFVRRDGGVFAASFDPEKRVFRHPPVPVLEGIETIAGSAAMALAPNGTLLFVPGAASQNAGTPTEALWVTREGRVTPVDSGWTYNRSINGGVALSPDDRLLALSIMATGSQDIWIKELDQGPFRRLTFDGVNVRPTWADGGKSVLYISRPDTGGTEDLKRRRSDGTGSPELLLDATRALFEVLTLRDTTQLLVRVGTPPSRDIYLLRRGNIQGDSGLTPLLAAPGYQEVSIALSPDERWLAYASDESGRYEVYVRPFPDVDGGRWQISRDGGNEPRWAHSGRELLYRSADGQMISVPLAPGTGFTPGMQTALFRVDGYVSSENYLTWVLTRDDRRFLFQRSLGSTGSSATTSAILVQHWLTEIAPRLEGQR